MILFTPLGRSLVEDTSTLPSDWAVQFDANRDTQSGADDSCPMFMSFDNDTQTKTYDTPPPKDDLVAFVKKFAQP